MGGSGGGLMLQGVFYFGIVYNISICAMHDALQGALPKAIRVCQKEAFFDKWLSHNMYYSIMMMVTMIIRK